MKRPQPLDLAAIVRTFEAIPELKSAGALAGATALHHEHLENRLGRFSFDIDLRNQRESVAAIDSRFSPATRRKLRLISRLNEDLYEYESRFARRIVRVEIARPYLRHRSQYRPSRHVPGLQVVSLADLLFAKVLAFSTRGLPRDLVDLLAAHQQKGIDWEALLLRAANSTDNDYNPAEFHRKLKRHQRECRAAEYWEELPVTKPPSRRELQEFIEALVRANRSVARSSL